MATQIASLSSIANDQAYVRVQYDDANMIATRAMWANLLATPVRCWVIKQDGTVILDTTIAANTPEQAKNLPGNQRFNIDTEAPNVNLAS